MDLPLPETPRMASQSFKSTPNLPSAVSESSGIVPESFETALQTPKSAYAPIISEPIGSMMQKDESLVQTHVSDSPSDDPESEELETRGKISQERSVEHYERIPLLGNTMDEASGTEQIEMKTRFERETSTSRQTEESKQASVPQKSLKNWISELLQWPLLYHLVLVFLLLWLAATLGINYPLFYFACCIYLYNVEKRNIAKMHRRIRHFEKKSASQKQLMSDIESVNWLNDTLEKAWPVWLGNFVSNQFLAQLCPFFLAKYKPWTAKTAELRSISLGRTPPMFTGIRIISQALSDDHVVLEAYMEFVAADDMSAVIAVQLRRRLGGLWTNLHISNLHVEGKIRIGIKFLNAWPFISRIRLSFESTPYLQITAKPLFTHGVDVSDFPGIANWLDTMLRDAMEQSVVTPNVLVISIERIADLFGTFLADNTDKDAASIPVCHLVLEILDATQLRPADLNGLADPFVKVSLNKAQVKTSIKKKTLNPKWMEEFRIPIMSWEEDNQLVLKVRDKDRFLDDYLGFCEVPLAKYRDGHRHPFSLPLKGVKTGRLNFAITLKEMKDPCVLPIQNGTNAEFGCTAQSIEDESDDNLEMSEETPLEMRPELDEFEVIDKSGIFSILRPGTGVSGTWHSRCIDKIAEDLSGAEGQWPSPTAPQVEIDSDEKGAETGKRRWGWGRGLRFHRHANAKGESQNLKKSLPDNDEHKGVKLMMVSDEYGSEKTNLEAAPRDATPHISSPITPKGLSEISCCPEETAICNDGMKSPIKEATNGAEKYLLEPASPLGLPVPAQPPSPNKTKSLGDNSLRSSFKGLAKGAMKHTLGHLRKKDKHVGDSDEDLSPMPQSSSNNLQAR